MAHDINIHIDTAKIEGFSVELREKLPMVRVTIGLYSGEAKITEFICYDTQCGYHSEIQLKLTPRIITSIKTLAKNLENAVMLGQSKGLLQLKGG